MRGKFWPNVNSDSGNHQKVFTFPPESVFTIGQNGCSRCARISVHVRPEYAADLLRLVFDTVVQRCNDEWLVKGEGFATDASYIKADFSRQRMVDGPVDWQPLSTQSRAVREYLDALDSDPAATSPQKRVSTTDPMAQ